MSWAIVARSAVLNIAQDNKNLSNNRLVNCCTLSKRSSLTAKGFFVVTTRLYELVDQAVEQTTPVIKRIANEVWQFAELSLQEIKSAQLIINILQEQGFTITSKGTAGVPTAFMAEHGFGTPTLGFLVEYDALPGLGNEPVPFREPRKDQVTSGHGCGHNLSWRRSTGAAIALKKVLTEQKIPGTIRVYGCAAEETEGAKVYMARAGLFKDLDAALHWTPVRLLKLVTTVQRLSIR